MPSDETPPTLGYATPDTTRTARPRRSPAAAVLQFVAGMVLAVVSVLGLIKLEVSTFWPILGVPIVMLIFRPTRLYGAGWPTALALTVLALAVICGAMASGLSK